MTLLTRLANAVFAGWNSDGSARKIVPHEAALWGTEIERGIEAAEAGRVDQVTWSGLVAIVGTRAGQPAQVLGPDAGTHTDPVVGGTVANTGTYTWSTSPAGWRRVGALPAYLVNAVNSGAGSGNAVQAVTDAPFSATAYQTLITINFVAANPGPMTVSINAETPRDLVLNTGGAIPSGYVSAGMAALLQIDSNGDYRLFSYGDASAIQAAAEAALASIQELYLGAHANDVAATAAAGGSPTTGALYWNTGSVKFRVWSGSAWADSSATNNVAVDDFIGDGTDDPLTLTGDPGSINNILAVHVEDIGSQPPYIFSLDGVSLFPPAGSIWPVGKKIYVSRGSSISIGTPADGTVTRAKIAAGAIGADEIDDEIINEDHIDATAAAAIASKIGVGTEDSPEFAGLTIGGIAVTPGGGTPISFSAHKNGTGQTGIATATYTKLTFGAEEWDDGGYYDVSTSRFTPPAGKYRVSAGAYWSSGIVSGEDIIIIIYKNGSVYKGNWDRASSTTNITSEITCLLDLDGDDYVEVFVRANGSGDKAVAGDSYTTYFQGERI